MILIQQRQLNEFISLGPPGEQRYVEVTASSILDKHLKFCPILSTGDNVFFFNLYNLFISCDMYQQRYTQTSARHKEWMSECV